MKRDQWVFELPSEQLAEAAEAKRKHHEARLAFWTDAQEKVMTDVREKGIGVETSLAHGSSTASMRYGMPEIVIDATYQRKLHEASAKIEKHRMKVAEYDGWVQVLRANKGRMYPLHADDYLFFFGK